MATNFSCPLLKSAPVFLACIVLVGILMSPGTIRAQQLGQITGRVSDAESKEYLPGANVMLKGTRFGAATDRNGFYRILNIPPATYELVVSYIGYQSVSVQDVQVKPNSIITQDLALKPGLVRGNEVIVWGTMAKGQARAQNQQLNALTIKSIVASDQMGHFPDANASEAIQRLPGVAIQRDMGEGRYVQIRGASAGMTTVTFNGEQIPGPEAGTRQVEIDMVPVDILESIEISKAITPDMDAEAVGGSVDLVTKKASQVTELSAEAAGGYAQIRSKYAGSGSLTFGTRFLDNALGLLVSGSWSRRDFGTDDAEPIWDLKGTGLADDVLSEIDVRYYRLYRIRQGATASLDYRLGENSTLFASGAYSELIDHEFRERIRNQAVDKRLTWQHKNRQEEEQVISLSAGGKHDLASGMKLDYRISLNTSHENTPFDNEIMFRKSNVNYSPDISNPDNILARPDTVEGTTKNPYNLYRMEPAVCLVEAKDIVGTLNITLPFAFGGEMASDVKFGGKFRTRDKSQANTENRWVLKSGQKIIMGKDLGVAFSPEGFSFPDYKFPSSITADGDVLDFVNRYGPKGLNLIEGAFTYPDVVGKTEFRKELEVNDYTIKEQTIAGYAMAEININPVLMVLPGVRYEYSTVTTDAWDWNPTTKVLTPKHGEKSYGYLFPMAHVRYRFGPRSNIRAAVTTTLARPNFYDMIPRRTDDGVTVNIGNPDLVPTRSLNLDLIFEHYDEMIGVMSGSVFYKSLTDPIYPFNDLYPGFTGGITQPRNGKSATVSGVEVALQKQLTFLPPPLDGLGFYGNYTYATSNTTMPDGREGRLPGQANHIFNIAVSFEKWGFSGQVSANYSGDFVTEFGSGAIARENDTYQDTHLQIDATASFRLTTQFTVFAEVNNITDEPYKAFRGTTERPIQKEYYQTWGRVGLRFKL